MFLRVIFTIVVLGFAALIALISKTAVDVQLLSTELSIPVAVMVWCFLALGFGLGMIWRRVPKDQSARAQNNQVPIIADLKVYE